MFYREFPPHPALIDHVQCIWLFEAAPHEAADDTQRIVPDGHPEMLLHFGDRFHEIHDDKVVVQSRLIFAGQLSKPLLLKPGASAGVVGVRFRSAGARALLGMPMAARTDTRLDLMDVWGSPGESLLDQIHSAADNTARVAVVEQFLLRRLEVTRIVPDAAIAACVATLRASNGHVGVDQLARIGNLSARQLERRFLNEVGIPPRLLASILRFRRVFDLFEVPQAGGWVEAALSAGYFDQAHMIRDFKRFAGVQPRAFYRGLGGLSAAMVGAG